MDNSRKDFYSYESRLYNRIIDITPLIVLKFWHRKLYKYDPLIHKAENLLEPASDLYYSITRPIRWFYRDNLQCLGSKLKRVKDYAKFAWSTNEYDYSSIFQLLKFKLGRMEGEIRNGGMHLNSEDTAEQIRIAKELLHILIEDDFSPIDEIDPPGGYFSDRESTREVRMTDSGAKQVFYVMECSSNKLSEEERQDRYEKQRKLYRYYNELRISMIRTICHIITPNHGAYKIRVEEVNEGIAKDLGIEPDDYWENMDKFKHDHSGVFGWWS